MQLSFVSHRSSGPSGPSGTSPRGPAPPEAGWRSRRHGTLPAAGTSRDGTSGPQSTAGRGKGSQLHGQAAEASGAPAGAPAKRRVSVLHLTIALTRGRVR